jgi:cysteine-S-conjugate beta-lyase
VQTIRPVADTRRVEALGGLNPELVQISLAQLRRRRSAKWRRFPPDVLPAWVAEMDFPLAPVVKRALGEAVEADDCGYAWPEDLGLAFSEFAARRLGWEVEPASVVPSSDVVSAISAVLAVLAQPGDAIVVNTPVYHPFFSIVADGGYRLAEAPLEDGRLDVEAIETRFAEGAVALLLCNPHNPAGSVPTATELQAVAAAAERHGAWVLADEIHAPLVFPDCTHVPFLTVSEEAAARGIAFCSASKAFNVAGLGCAQIIASSPAAATLVGRLPAGATHCGHFGLIATLAAYAGGAAWLDGILAVLGHNRRLLAHLLEAQLPEVGYRQPEAGYLAWLDLRELSLGDDPAEQILERGRLALSPGLQFGPQGAGFARLNFGTAPTLVIEAVERLVRGAGRA